MTPTVPVRVRRVVNAPLVVVASLVLLLASIGVGLRRDPFAFLNPFGRAPSLDYSAGPGGGFAPLDSRYVADLLGLGVDTPVDASPATTGPAGRAARAQGFEPPSRLTDAHPLTNDDRSDARRVSGVPFTARTNTAGASREAGEPSECSRVGSSTVWYRYRPARDLGLIANTFGSDHSTALGVFTQNLDGSLSNIGCDLDVNGNAIYQFAATRGVTYLFQIVGPTRGGNLVFNLDPQGRTTLASTNPAGEPGDNASAWPVISADGRFVAFLSTASDVAPGGAALPCLARERGDGVGRTLIGALHPSQPCWQVIVRDRQTGSRFYASVNDAGELANGDVYQKAISGNGRYVAFTSTATNLVDEDGDGAFDDDTNHIGDLFVHDLLTRRTERIYRSFDGKQVEFEPDLQGSVPIWGASAFDPTISHDGRYVAFSSSSSRLVEEDYNADYDVFVWDRHTRANTRVSVSSEGREGNGDSGYPCLSGDGRYVAFTSWASTLVWGDEGAQLSGEDSNGWDDLFVHDRETGTTTLETVTIDGMGTNEYTWGGCVLSPDARFLVFSSAASNLVEGDTNSTDDVFVRDRLQGVTTRVSVSSSGEQARSEVNQDPQTGQLYGGAYAAARYGPASPSLTGLTFASDISADGRYVSFFTIANGLVPEDNTDNVDVFVHDRRTDTTIRVSVNSSGDPFQGDSVGGGMSADGRVIVFDSAPQLRDPLKDSLLLDLQVYVHERMGTST